MFCAKLSNQKTCKADKMKNKKTFDAPDCHKTAGPITDIVHGIRYSRPYPDDITDNRSVFILLGKIKIYIFYTNQSGQQNGH